jgi:PTH1 family peptidyl-tRNA hydrolase
MLLVCGLGNVGKQYSNTRHNAGFLFLDYLSATYDLHFRQSKDFCCELSRYLMNDVEILFIKPTTFMNNSGLAIANITRYYKIPSENLLVIHDDLDLPLGRTKMKIGGGSAGHNGIKSIDACIGKEYWRIRIGIGRSLQNRDVFDHVLGEFTAEELSQVELAMSECKDLFLNFIDKAKSGYKGS